MLTSERSMLEHYEETYRKQGWVVVKLPRPDAAVQVRAALLGKLREISGVPDITLERYHEIAEDDELHSQYQIELTEFFRANHFAREVLAAQQAFFRPFLGPDLLVQVSPYLRIARPGKPQDNIGYHRDTFYGASAYELSVWVPYVDLPAESSMSLLAGSHVRPESDFPVTQIQSDGVTRGSAKHKMGFPYAPKVMDPAPLTHLEPVPVLFGEALVLSLAAVHGSTLNSGSTSRWSTDIRVVNALAPIDFGTREGYYEPLSTSVVSEQAELYYRAQWADQRIRPQRKSA